MAVLWERLCHASTAHTLQQKNPKLHQRAAPLEEIRPGVGLFGRIAQRMGKRRLRRRALRR